ncbi:MAG: tetratricopeptide repeat protein [Thermoguttaceae bacterium]
MENSRFIPQLLNWKKRILLTKKWFLFGIVVISTLGLACKKEPAAQSNTSAPVLEAKSAPLPLAKNEQKTIEQKALAGSKTCRDCHEEFYKLWSTSWHGLAMQPYTAEFAKANLTPQEGDVAIGKRKYRAEVGQREGWVKENGPGGVHNYPIAHVMGGKNVYYFLTPMDRGRLQVLPVAYDVHKKNWYDMAASGVRHFPDRRDEALDWTDRMFSFNTTCFNCHVSELSTNYDLATDTYHTTWAESGISCESCHGPGAEHARAMEAGLEITLPSPVLGEAPKGYPGVRGHTSKDIKIIRTKEFSAEQMNDMCATCHAKLVPLSTSFLPGDMFFDHYDLVTLEHQDYYPDGRDLGENYTYTSWLMSPCVKSGKLDCNHCHTPSGRMRFEGENSNQSCMPCHEHYVKNPADHGKHQPGSKGNECIACHMPMTRFAAMGRTDHSMRSPAPAASMAFKSPNACNLCHADKDAAWSEEWVRKWYPRDYQAEVLRRGELIDQARKRDWNRLPEMLDELKKKDNDPVYKNSLVRLLRGCDDESKWPVVSEMLHDASPLVRSSAASSLGDHITTPEALKALLVATADESRLVRIRSAISLAALQPKDLQNDRDRRNLNRAVDDFMAAMTARGDDWASYANVGNFYMDRGDYPAAIGYFETAARLEPRQIGPSVNAAIAYSNLGRGDQAEVCLMQALKYEPDNAAANFNLGLLRGEQNRLPEAEQALRKALKADPQMHQAAYNLGVLLGDKNLDQAVEWCEKAHQLRPNDPKYAHTLAFYERQTGNIDSAIELLRQVIQRNPHFWDSYLLLGQIYQDRRDFQNVAAVYRQALKMEQLPSKLRKDLEARIKEIESEAPVGSGNKIN